MTQVVRCSWCLVTGFSQVLIIQVQLFFNMGWGGCLDKEGGRDGESYVIRISAWVCGKGLGKGLLASSLQGYELSLCCCAYVGGCHSSTLARSMRSKVLMVCS